MSRKKELAKNTAILTFGKVCTQFVSFLLLPLYTALLETSEYGVFDLMITYGTLLLPLVNLQLDQGLFRFMLNFRGDVDKTRTLFSTVFVGSSVQCGIYVILLTLVNQWMHLTYAVFLILYVVLQVFTAMLLQFIRGLGRNKVYAMASFISASSNVALNVIMLVALRKGVQGLFIATIVSHVLTIIYMCAAVKPWKYFRFSCFEKQTFSQIRKYSLPMVPNSLAWWVVNASDRTIVSHILGVAVNGIYTVANKFSNVFVSFYNILNLSWTETVSLHYFDSDGDSFISDTMTSLYKLFSSACFGIVAVMPFIFPIMIHSKYADSYPQILILMYAMLFRVVVGLYTTIYVATKESKKIAYTAIASAVINIAVNLSLIGVIGLYAASLSTLVAFSVMALIRYFDINRHAKIRIEKKTILISLLVAIELAVTYYINNLYLNLLSFVIVCAYAVISNWSLALAGKKMLAAVLKRK
ncbi:MAG: lipopolysaccharide biosynthesis protein [Lachnospiraceae bacterium]|nr:lipopolysaccharide biosynthesis protein [Lachnospiraceae bacterium]